MSISIDGFSPENQERIYLGEPAVVGWQEKLPADALSDRQYEIAELAVEGFSYEEIVEQLDRSMSTVRTHLSEVYVRLGIASKSGLAGFFPIDPEDAMLESKTLGQLARKSLQAVEGLSQGKPQKTISADMGVAQSTARTHVHNALGVWADCPNATVLTRVANGIRANYSRKIITNGNGISNLVGFAFYNLVDYEPRIRELLGMPGGMGMM